MKTTLKIFTLLFALFAFVSCSDDDEDTSKNFTVTTISPESATVGTEITVTGTDFPTETSQVELTVGGAIATIISLSSTQIVATVPQGAVSGAVSVNVDGNEKMTSTDFTVLSDLINAKAENIFAPQTGGQGQPIGGPFAKFSFETGAVTDSDTEWDIAFRGTTIAVNGGALTGTSEEPERNGNAAAGIVDGIFTEVLSTEGISFIQDADAAFAIPTGSDNGWYNYNFMTNLVTPIPGKILVFRTHDDKVAKVEILSYYQDAPANPDAFASPSRYYTFNYVYNPNEGKISLQ
ncbi:IPT/TIG domain-containing protein [Maribacter antarcticus]|uniref:IPT/TIG domain-containing protein n=1 Tax=Maribacter antarcticus TaxID=505250 RepID=UPI000A0321E6|nr:IPT/TIG domain-containing protein [Maribacter antarcticus]